MLNQTRTYSARAKALRKKNILQLHIQIQIIFIRCKSAASKRTIAPLIAEGGYCGLLRA